MTTPSEALEKVREAFTEYCEHGQCLYSDEKGSFRDLRVIAKEALALLHIIEGEITQWQPIETAPKELMSNFESKPILATDCNEIKIVVWTTQYPYTNGCWSYGWEYSSEDDDEGIGHALVFYPTLWKPAPVLPHPPAIKKVKP